MDKEGVSGGWGDESEGMGKGKESFTKMMRKTRS